ncbi:murein hydrolase activator EnvC family protein [Micromonospora auratinigra]
MPGVSGAAVTSPARATPPPALPDGAVRSAAPVDAVVPEGGGPDVRFGWPLPGPPRPVRRFDPPPQPWLPGHRGVDLAATSGAPVRAAGAGIVLFAGTVAGRPVVTVGHADGLRTTYEPVRPGLAAGTRLGLGTPIGTLLAGHAGCPAEACLHWGLRRGADYLDPLALLGLGPVRLLPLDADAASPARTEPGQPWASSVGSRAANRSYSSGTL